MHHCTPSPLCEDERLLPVLPGFSARTPELALSDSFAGLCPHLSHLWRWVGPCSSGQSSGGIQSLSPTVIRGESPGTSALSLPGPVTWGRFLNHS